MDNNRRPIGDMYLAAALLSYNVILLEIDREDVRKQRFIFDATSVPPRVFVVTNGMMMSVENPKFEDIENSFVSRTLLFPPSYPDSIRRIKSAIHSGA